MVLDIDGHSFFTCLEGLPAAILPDRHLITKRYTLSIKWQTLNVRTRIKHLAHKTLCLSKSVEIHKKVIGEFINLTFFNSSKV